MDIGMRIARLRKEKELTQAELADQLHVSPKTVSKWENGYGLPDIKILPELAGVLGVDADYLLTGRGVPLKSETTAQKTPSTTVAYEDVPEAKGIYELRLWQVTHSNLTAWLLVLNMIMMFLSVIGSPISEINTEGYWRPYAVLAFLYPSLTEGTSALYVLNQDLQVWLIAITILWLVYFVFFAALCIRGVAASLDGRNDYCVKFAWVQFGGSSVMLCLSFSLCTAINLAVGEVCVRPNGVFAALVVCSLAHLILTLFFDRHRKPIGHLKAGSALSGIAVLAMAVTFCVLPNAIVPTVFAADSVQLSGWQVQLQLTDPSVEELSWQNGYSVLSVRANVKLTEMAEDSVEFTVTKKDGTSHSETHPANAVHLHTFYKGGYYHNLFRVNFDFVAEGGDTFRDFTLTFSLSRNSPYAAYSVNCAEPDLLPDDGEMSAFYDRGDRVAANGGNVGETAAKTLWYDLLLCEDTRVLGYESNLNTPAISYALGEYAEFDKGMYEFVGFGSESEILQPQTELMISTYTVKDGANGYTQERRVFLQICRSENTPLPPYSYIRILTDRGSIPIVHEWSDEVIAESYEQRL